MNYYDLKKLDYFKNIREEFINIIPSNPEQKILEVGAGGGDTLIAIKEMGNAIECVGVELFEIPNSNQKNKQIDKFIFANLETDELHLDEKYFDLVICGDVLEHLVDPWSVVENLTRFIKPGGLFILSIPNIREICTMYKIFFQKDFRYNIEGGILDKTHLRFFCKKNSLDLMTTNVLKPIAIFSNFEKKKKAKRKLLNLLTLGLFKDLLTPQYLIIAQKHK